MLTDTLHNTFTTLFGGIYKNVSFQVRGVSQFSGQFGTAVRNPIPESLLPEDPLGARRRGRGRDRAGLRTVRLAVGLGDRQRAARRRSGCPSTPTPRSPSSTSSTGARPPRPRRRHGPRHGAEVRLPRGSARQGAAAGAARDVHHQRPREVRDGEQPGRGHAGGVPDRDRAAAVRRGRPVRLDQRRRRARARTRRRCSAPSPPCSPTAWRSSPPRP